MLANIDSPDIIAIIPIIFSYCCEMKSFSKVMVCTCYMLHVCPIVNCTVTVQRSQYSLPEHMVLFVSK